MARADYPISIVEFQRRFADEGACLSIWAASRWPDGYFCPAWRRVAPTDGALQRRQPYGCQQAAFLVATNLDFPVECCSTNGDDRHQPRPTSSRTTLRAAPAYTRLTPTN